MPVCYLFRKKVEGRVCEYMHAKAIYNVLPQDRTVQKGGSNPQAPGKSVASIWFEIWGVVDSVTEKIPISTQKIIVSLKKLPFLPFTPKFRANFSFSGKQTTFQHTFCAKWAIVIFRDPSTTPLRLPTPKSGEMRPPTPQD